MTNENIDAQVNELCDLLVLEAVTEANGILNSPHSPSESRELFRHRHGKFGRHLQDFARALVAQAYEEAAGRIDGLDEGCTIGDALDVLRALKDQLEPVSA